MRIAAAGAGASPQAADKPMRSDPPHGLALWRRLLLASALVLAALSPLAWDIERMAGGAAPGPQAVQGVRALQPVLASLAEADAAARLDG